MSIYLPEADPASLPFVKVTPNPGGQLDRATTYGRNGSVNRARESIKAISAAMVSDAPLIIVLDEVTESVAEIGKSESPERAREFLAEHRRIRETYPQIRWVLTGSIGFHHVLRQIGTTTATLGDTQHFVLGSLSPGWSMWLAGSVLTGAGIADGHGQSAAVRAEIAAVTDGIPILIHLIGQYLRDGGRDSVDVEEIQQILDTCFQQQDLSANLTHLLTRLTDYYEDTVPPEVVLDHVASQPTTQSELLLLPRVTRALLQSLEADHYLGRNDANRFVWKYPSLARLWAIRRGL